MGIYIDLKDEIHSNLLSQSSNPPGVSWSKFVLDMRLYIISKYHNTQISRYKAIWKQAFRNGASFLSLQVDMNEREDCWKNEIVPELKRKSSEDVEDSDSSSKQTSSKSCASTSSLLYQRKLLPSDYLNISQVSSKLTKKWKLKSHRMVEDIVFETSKEFVVEHPAHSFILDTKDPVWKEAFSDSELDEVESAANIFEFNKPFPLELQDIILKLNRKSTFKDIYDAVASVEAHPIDSPDKFWLKQSILNYTMQFIDSETLSPFETEQDLLDDVFGFIKTSCRLSGTKAYGAKQSQASSECKNYSRSIGSVSEVVRKQSAENADLSFRYISHELFCLEIGLRDNGPNDTKELNESYIKTPLMMKNFCLHLVSQYKMDPSKVKIMGVIISGHSIKALGMSFEKGSMSLLSTSERLHMPETASEIPRLLPPVLNLVYNINKVIEATVNELKEMNSSIFIEPEIKSSLPPCFVPVASTTTSKKRKSRESS